MVRDKKQNLFIILYLYQPDTSQTFAGFHHPGVHHPELNPHQYDDSFFTGLQIAVFTAQVITGRAPIHIVPELVLFLFPLNTFFGDYAKQYIKFTHSF